MASERGAARKIIILGAGGNSLSIVEAIESINASGAGGSGYKLEGFLDDLRENQGKSVAGYPVLGRIEEARELDGCQFINGISSVDSFRQMRAVVERTALPRSRFETIVHPKAIVSRRAKIGAGCAVMAGSVICADAELGDHVIVLQNTSVNHHSRLGDFVTLSAGITILGFVDVRQGAFIGGGASVAPKLKIGASALVGTGAVVIRDVAAGSVVAGNPARELPDSRYALQQPRA